MAKIKNIEQQKEALSQIAKLIADVKTMNEFISNENESNTYKLTSDSASGKLKIVFKSTKKDQINALVNDYKEELTLEILSLANDNNIDLEEEDKIILGINE